MNSLSFVIVVAFICWVCVVRSLPSDIEDDTILSGTTGSVPVIGEVNAGIGATIDVSAIKAALEEKNPPPPPVLTLDDFKKKSVKQLKEYLKERGLECKGCSEKGDFVKLAYDHRETPVTTTTTTPSEEKKPAGTNDVPDGEKLDQSKIDELLANLKRNGFGNNRFFNADDLKDLSPEELNAKFNDPNYKAKFSSTKSSKKSSDKSKKSGGKKDSSNSSKGKAKTESKPKPQRKKAESKPSKPSKPVAEEHHHEEETIEL